MRQPLRSRIARAIVAGGLVLSTILPRTAATAAEGDLILKTGTDQDLQVLNPFNSVVVADFEVFTLNYDLLVNFGPDIEPAPGFAESWTQSSDGKSWTFKIRPGMKWSDGQPATAEDVRWTYQLILDAVAKSDKSADGYSLGQGYLEPYLTNAGVTKVEAIDPTTVKITTEFANTLLLQAYVPILPKHIWSKHTMDEIANAEGSTAFLNEPAVVGTGPYQAVEWKPGEFIRFVRNANYWGTQGAADEVIIQHFAAQDTMVQALKSGEIDYVRGVLADQFNALKTEPDIATVEGVANGYTELAWNTGGNKKGYAGSTSALSDVAFRDALGYAIDTQKLVDSTLGGYGTPGSTIIPPFHTRWHVEPDKPRRFDIAEANRRLDAAGYPKNADGKRVDKDGKVINLRLTWPDSEAENATNAQFLVEWFGQAGITVTAAVTEEGKLIDDVTGPPAGPANYDIYMWGWVGDPDPTSLLNFFRSEEIGASSDSYYNNPHYDELFLQQRAEPDEAKRKAILAEMQNLVYDEAPYHILYYDAELHAYRTDKFAGWTNQPTTGGTPLFGYGSRGYTLLTDASATPSAAPSADASAATGSGAPGSGAPGASATVTGSGTPSPTTTPTSSTGSSMPLVLGVIALIVIVAIGLVVMRGRSRRVEEE
ncbi:MAG: peptide/nickel transport system substrate-binding protein [Chloroflexota bacterium]|jgi:peptide/nickel transport system substrate-binding protein|nr:peptide/nickel transport system substrate-binding protein [Chloroflexota bacterium]